MNRFYGSLFADLFERNAINWFFFRNTDIHLITCVEKLHKNVED